MGEGPNLVSQPHEPFVIAAAYQRGEKLESSKQTRGQPVHSFATHWLVPTLGAW